MKRVTKTLVAAAFLAISTPGFGQHIIGGGDPVMMIFAEAKYEAGRILTNLDLDALPSARVRTWLGETITYRGEQVFRHQAMAREMERSTHAWKEGEVGFNKCAVIRLDPAEEPAIELSLPRCRAAFAISSAGGAEALRTLIHEISHRVGMTTSHEDELFASDVAVAVFNTWRIERQGGVPFWTGTDEMLSARFRASAVWTGAGTSSVSNQLLVWGGCNENPMPGSGLCKDYLATGARLVYEKEGPLGEPPVTRWVPMSEFDAPVGRQLHTAVWTGETKLAAARNKMLIFGGCRSDDTSCEESLGVTPGSRYDAETDKWLPLASEGAPSPRVYHTAVWTAQDEMIVWGGLQSLKRSPDNRVLGDGAILSFPEGKPEGVWRPIPRAAPDAPSGSPTRFEPAARYGHSGLWTGTELLIWGGCGQVPGITRCVKELNDGAILRPDPADGEPWWEEITAPASVTPRVSHSAIWTGRYLIVWGGANGGRVLANGARWDSVDGSWKLLNPTLPEGERGRKDHVAVFEPLQGRMIIWGGVGPGSTYPTKTLIYDIASDRWSYSGTETDPVGREGHVATWIQDSLFVWGGYNRDNGFLSQGGIFNP